MTAITTAAAVRTIIDTNYLCMLLSIIDSSFPQLTPLLVLVAYLVMWHWSHISDFNVWALGTMFSGCGCDICPFIFKIV